MDTPAHVQLLTSSTNTPSMEGYSHQKYWELSRLLPRQMPGHNAKRGGGYDQKVGVACMEWY